MSCGLPLLLDPYSVAVGVGHSPPDDEEPLASVWGSDVAGADAGCFHRITRGGEVGDNSVQTPPNESRDVLGNDEARRPAFVGKLPDESDVLAPEAGALTVDAGSLASDTGVLTGEATAQDINVGNMFS